MKANMMHSLLIPMFVLDFLSIHPFNDGNGRMSRLLPFFCFIAAGTSWAIYQHRDAHREIEGDLLRCPEIKFHRLARQPELLSSIRKLLSGIFIKAYQEFQDRVEHLHGKTLSKAERIKAVFHKKLGKITKADIANLCPDISISTIERTLKEMLVAEEIEKVGERKRNGIRSEIKK